MTAMDPMGVKPYREANGTYTWGAAKAQPGRALAQSIAMLNGWGQAGITRADLVVRRPDGAMLWQHDCPLDRLPLPWARAHNVRRGDIYIRPARGYSWPMVFLDDVIPEKARLIARKYATVIVHTSPSGGCHLWLWVTTTLDEHQRYQAQRWLVPRAGADPGSVSGEHLGRLAGMKNWKRHGVWVNVLDCGNPQAPPWDPTPALQAMPPDDRPLTSISRVRRSSGVDYSESAREWGWVCGALEAGTSPDTVYQQLVERASLRRGRDAERYASHTIKRAIHHLG
jgi:hypothetical protein